MDSFKPWFIPIYLPLTLLAIIHALLAMLFGGGVLWLTVVLANIPILVFIGWLSRSGAARTSPDLPAVCIPAVGFGLLGLLALAARDDHSRWLIPFYSVLVGTGGTLAYIFWYSRLGRDANRALVVGEPMPDIELEDDKGRRISTRDLAGQPTVFLFYRGNWCPLCMAQIREVADRYQALKAKGAQVALISPQSHAHTRELAARYDVDFRFLVDPESRAAKQLGIFHEGGLPKGMDRMLGYDSDTVMPTVVITDADNTIVFADLTDNYRVRPEPDLFLEVLEHIQRQVQPL